MTIQIASPPAHPALAAAGLEQPDWLITDGRGRPLGALPRRPGHAPAYDPDDDMKRRAEERAAERE